MTPRKHIAAGNRGISLQLFLHVLPSGGTGVLLPPFPVGNLNVAKLPV